MWRAISARPCVAGSDTTSASVSWTVHHLAASPEWQRRCREEVLAVLGTADWRAAAAVPDALRRTPLLRACIDETMRLHPPVTRLPPRVVMLATSQGIIQLNQWRVLVRP